MIKVTATAKVEHMRPAHKAFIVKFGDGRAIQGLRAKNILPMQITLQECLEIGDR